MAAHAVLSTLTSPQISAQVIFGGQQLIEQSADAWRTLCDESQCAPFYRPEWISTYIKAFEPDCEVALFTAHADGKLAAVLPMIRKQAWYAGIPVKMLSGAGNVHSVHFGIAHAPGPVGDAANLSIWNLIKQTPGWHLLQLPMFPAGGSCDLMLQRAQQEGYRTLKFPVQESPVLYMTRDAEGKLTWLGGTNRHFRHELRRFARLLEETAGAKPTLLRFDHPEPRVLKQFYALEAAGWKGQEGSAINCDPATQAFYDQIAREATQRGYFSLHTLDVDGKMAAGAFSVRTNECFYPMKIAHNEEWRRGAPGHLLFNGMLEECAAANIPEFFFGGSKDRYKTSWTQDSIPHYNGFIFAPGIRGELAFHLRTQVLSRLGRWRRDYRQWREQRSVVKNSVVQHKSAQNSGLESKPVENSAAVVTPANKPGSQKAKAESKSQSQHPGRSIAMKVSLICCPFKTSFGSYALALKSAIERKTGDKVQWVGTNCGCGDPVEVNRDFEAKECDYFELPILVDFRSNSAWKRKVRGAARSVMVARKAKKYAALSKGAEVVHFQQILNAYGSKGVFSWLKQESSARRIVTVHELDADQTESPETNLTYNRAHAVIAHCDEMRQQLIKLGVDPERVHVVLHGTDLPQIDPSQKREGIVFYGGHKLMSGKGIESLFQTMAIIQKQLGDSTPKLTIHGHYGPVTPEGGKKLAEENGVAHLIVWANQISDDQIMRLYSQSAVCVLPFTGSFAGQPASFAAATALPVVCTRKAGLTDHLGDTAIYIDENPDGKTDPAKSQQLADRILDLLKSETLRKQCGIRLRARAEKLLGWDTIADQTLKIYEGAAGKTRGARAS